MKIRTLVAAVALASVSNGASAAIAHGAGVDGEFFLTLFDEVGQQSYAIDLGLNLSEMNANTTLARSYDLSTDANFNTFMGNVAATDVSNMRWTLTATNNILAGRGQDPALSLNYGFMATSNDSLESMQAVAPSRQAIDGVISNIQNMALNTNASAGDNYDGTNEANNLSNIALVGQIGYYGDPSWGDTVGNRGFVSSSLVDTSMSLYSIHLDNGDTTVPTVTDVLGQWSLSSTGQLTYAGVSAVPVPAAAWLFGSGLLGLVGVARRKSA